MFCHLFPFLRLQRNDYFFILTKKFTFEIFYKKAVPQKGSAVYPAKAFGTGPEKTTFY